jgi:hypothetical protein
MARKAAATAELFMIRAGDDRRRSIDAEIA